MWLMYRLRRPRERDFAWRPEKRVARAIQATQHLQLDNGTWRVSSAAFSPAGADNLCSVDIEELLERDGLRIDSMYPSLERSVGLAALRVEQVTSEGLRVVHDPVPTDWYHGGIGGDALKRPAVKKRLARACDMIVPLDQQEANRISSARPIQS